MREELIVASTVAGISDPSGVGDLADYSFVIGPMHFYDGGLPSLSGSGITGAEAVTLWKLVGSTWVKVYDGSGSVVQLTETNPHVAIETEGKYGVTKTTGTGIEVTVQMP